jgi:hypothetical protein
MALQSAAVWVAPYTLVLPPVVPNQMWVAYCLVYLPVGAGAVDRGVGVVC